MTEHMIADKSVNSVNESQPKNVMAKSRKRMRMDYDEEKEKEDRMHSRKIRRYRRVTGRYLDILSYGGLLHSLHLNLVVKDKKESFQYCESGFEYMVSRLEQLQKRAIDYVSLWDARTPEMALNWLISHPDRRCRYNFVELVLEEQPEKNFWEALEQICKAWNAIRNKYSYLELFYNKIKSDEVKLQYCDWLLTTEREKRNVKLYTFHELLDRLREKLLPEKINDSDFEDFYSRIYEKFYAISYVCYFDVKTPEEAFNWMISLNDQYLRRQFLYFVRLEQPEKNFWETLKWLCKTRNNIRSEYSYNELFNNDGDERE